MEAPTPIAKDRLVAAIAGAVAVVMLGRSAAIAAPAPVLVSGTGDAQHTIVLAVLAEGYTKQELPGFRADVDALLVGGLLNADVYRAAKDAFSVYRVDLASDESGLGTAQTPRNSALRVSYNGDVASCWFDLAPDTEARIDAALAALPRTDFALVLANSGEFGGCSRGIRLFVTKGSGWTVVAHEYGHSIGELFDEYTRDDLDAYDGGPVNDRNCTTSTSRGSIPWTDLISPRTAIPTKGADATTVGAYAGCEGYRRGIYHPTVACRMNTNLDAPFCPVCARAMNQALHRPLPLHLVASASNDLSSDTEVSERAKRKLSRVQARISATGELRIVGVSPLETGASTTVPHAGGVVYEFSPGNARSVAGHLEHDPFLARSYAPPGQARAHRDVPIEEATINVIAPTDADSRRNPGALNLYQLQRPAKRATGQAAAAPAPLDRLRRSGRLKTAHVFAPNQMEKAWNTFDGGSP